MEDQTTFTNRRIYAGELVSVGLFRCSPGYPHFSNTGPTRRTLLVFPRTSVTITHAGREPVVATPNVVMFYNLGQEYRRGRISERGDLCDWFEYSPGVLVEALRPYHRWVEDHPERPFSLSHAQSDARSYLLQRRVVEHLLSSGVPDRLFVEESLLKVLDCTLVNAFGLPERARTEKRSHRDVVNRLKELLAARFAGSLTLDGLAAELHYSPFHLCRLFHRSTGVTIHQYLNRLRLRTALEWMSGGRDLGEVAFHLGYSSHSHFSAAFRKEFGASPSTIRASF